MPILEIQIVGDLPSLSREGLAQKLADAAGEALHSRQSGTWVKVQFINSENYAENGGASPDILPVFVHIIQRSLPANDELVRQTASLAKAVASVCHRPEQNVHIIYEPSGRGRVAFGGSLTD